MRYFCYPFESGDAPRYTNCVVSRAEQFQVEWAAGGALLVIPLSESGDAPQRASVKRSDSKG